MWPGKATASLPDGGCAGPSPHTCPGNRLLAAQSVKFSVDPSVVPDLTAQQNPLGSLFRTAASASALDILTQSPGLELESVLQTADPGDFCASFMASDNPKLRPRPPLGFLCRPLPPSQSREAVMPADITCWILRPRPPLRAECVALSPPLSSSVGNQLRTLKSSLCPEHRDPTIQTWLPPPAGSSSSVAWMNPHPHVC